MVSNSGTSLRASGLRALNAPRPITVLTRHGTREPDLLIEGERRRHVDRIQDVWHIDDEWWRDPIVRRYYQVLLDDGVVCTIYHDLEKDVWFIQAY